jgi:hypothetical protein
MEIDKDDKLEILVIFPFALSDLDGVSGKLGIGLV